MLRPGMLLALPLAGTFLDALLRTDFAIRKHPSYKGGLAPPLVGLSPTRSCVLTGHALE
jgi:hypothetical protein